MRTARDRAASSKAAARATSALHAAFPEPDGPRMVLLIDCEDGGVESVVMYGDGDDVRAAYLDSFRLAWWVAHGMYREMTWRERRKANRLVRRMRHGTAV